MTHATIVHSQKRKARQSKSRRDGVLGAGGALKGMPFDPWLLLAVGVLLGLGLLMVGSASMVIAQQQYGHPLYFLLRQLRHLAIGLVLAGVACRLPMAFWQRMGVGLLFASLFLLVLVLIPGVGHRVNGSMRWLNLGFMRLQVSELAKFGLVVYLAGYIQRQRYALQHQVSGFLKPMALLGVVMILLLLEPDFGATVVLMATVLGMLFLAGAPLWEFMLLVLAVGCGLLALALAAPYRLERLTTFLNPWADQFNSGYQLTQSLIAFGRGGWLGVGLGEGIQKLFYLPEAHTDFLFAVVGEELGLMGLGLIIVATGLLIGRILLIAHRAVAQGQCFSGFLSYGIGLWLGLQALVNMGVNTGILPTKGLTFPLMSYGGSSLITSCIAIGLLLRVDYEARREALSPTRGGVK